MKRKLYSKRLLVSQSIKENFPVLFKYDARSIHKKVYLYKISATVIASVTLFLSTYHNSFVLMEILLLGYLALNVVLYIKPSLIAYKFYNNWSLYLDMLFISSLVIIRGGIRSDFFLGYILTLQYLAYLPETKPIILTLIPICILYALSCVLAIKSLNLDWGRYIIRISFFTASYYIISYSIKQIKSADAIKKYAFDKVFHDTLTGVYNRNLYEEVFSEQNITHSGLCCVMLDIDNMKQINDTYGHQAGDKVLKTIGEIILSNIRETDICIRYGGDEFFILFNHISEKDCFQLMQRIMNKVRVVSIKLDNATIHFSASYGLYAIPHGTTYEAAVAEVDKRLYENKRTNKHTTIQ